MQEPVLAGMESERFVRKLSIRANGTRRKHDTSVEIADCVQTLVVKSMLFSARLTSNCSLLASHSPNGISLVTTMSAPTLSICRRRLDQSVSLGLSVTAPSKIASFIASLRMLDAVWPIARAVIYLVSALSRLSSKGAERFTLPL